MLHTIKQNEDGTHTLYLDDGLNLFNVGSPTPTEISFWNEIVRLREEVAALKPQSKQEG